MRFPPMGALALGSSSSSSSVLSLTLTLTLTLALGLSLATATLTHASLLPAYVSASTSDADPDAATAQPASYASHGQMAFQPQVDAEKTGWTDLDMDLDLGGSKALFDRPKGSDNKAVQWDQYSLVVAGQRMMIFSVEFHPWRLPVPDLWRDVLEKIKAAGFNTVSIYWHWGLVQASPDPATINLEGINDLEFFLSLAEDVGLFVIVRPGPYINAETTAGGMAPWSVNLDAILRTNATIWHDAWRPYIKAVANVTAPHQLRFDPKTGAVSGGSVILVQADNEYHSGPSQNAYIQQLTDSLKKWGITVPVSYNDASRDRNFISIVDLYGYDSYPQMFDCSNPYRWNAIPSDYRAYHQSANPSEPWYIPEFQGGSYDPYEGPGYDACGILTNANFARVANQALWAQSVTMLSIYMGFGGTNWGGLAEPDVYSSYDYGAAISENRQLTPKYSEYSVQGHFLRSFPDLAKTDLEDEGAGKEIVGGSNTFWTTKLRNPDSGARFYVVRHTDSTSTDVSQLRLNVTTSHGWYAVPRFGGALTLAGRDSRMVPTDKVLPQGTHLLYTTASTFLAHAIGGTDVLVMHGDPGQDFEASFVARNTSHVTVTPHNDGKSSVKAVHDLLRGDVTVGWDVPASDSVSHATLTIDGRDTLLVLADTLSAYKMYAPTIASGARSKSRFANFWGVGTNETVLVSGAPFVRNASLAGLERDTLVLEGQTNSSTRLSVFAPPHVTQLIWNGEKLDEVSRTVWGGLEADVAGPSAAVANFQPPKLTDWKYADSLPEVGLEPFDDSEWTLANKTKSHNPYWHSNTVQTDGQVLFADEYGYHANNLLWRGAFRSSPSTNSSKSHSHSHSNKDDSSDYVGRETGLTVQLEGGRSFAFSVWLNEVFLGSAYGDRDNGAKEATFVFPKGAVRKGENVVTILQDHMGLEMERGALPIGLQSHGENPEARISRRGQKAPIVTPFADPDDELEATKLPRGIISYLIKGAKTNTTMTWKVAGNLGGESAPDKVRTFFNEGGLYGERAGWHLPGFDDSQWQVRSPTDGLPPGRAGGGVGFFRTTFNLNLPTDHDVALGVRFPSASDSESALGGPGRSQGKYRAQLYVNGWQLGKRVAHLGPQTYFPVPQGILDYKGENTIAISLWALDGKTEDRKLENPLEIEVEARWRGAAAPVVRTNNPGWKELRGKKGH